LQAVHPCRIRRCLLLALVLSTSLVLLAP
jgi:hypothetical protein